MHILAYVGMLAIGLLAAAIVYCALVPPNFGPPRVEHRTNPFSHAQMLASCIDMRHVISNADYVRATITSVDVLLTHGDIHGRKVTVAQVAEALDDWTHNMRDPQDVLRCLPAYAASMAGTHAIGYRITTDALVRESMKRWRLAHAQTFKAKA